VPDVVVQHTATRAPAVDLVEPELAPNVKLTPGLDEDGAAGFLSEQGFERGTFVGNERYRCRRFDLAIIQTLARQHPRRG